MLAPWNGRTCALALLSVALGSGACTSMLGIDGEYVSEGTPSPDAGGGGGRSTDTGGEGGGSESGGTTGIGIGGTGASASGGVATASCSPSCSGGNKCCPGAPGIAPHCAAREPSVGCSLDACDPCPDVPPDSTPVCTAGLCDFKCNDKFERVGAVCQLIAAGSTGGSGNTGGAGGQGGAGTGGTPPCVATKCPSLGGPVPGCSIASPFGCCQKDGKCGCSYVGMAYCL
jgi:hypothetical protein